MNTREISKARDIMATRFLRLKPDLDIYEATDLLLKHRVANAPVVDDQDRLIGFLSEKDCIQTLVDGAYSSNPSTSVERCMSRDVQSISEETDLLAIANIFLTHPYRRLPVVRDGILVGLISRRDFLSGMAEWTRIDADQNSQPSFLYLSKVADSSVIRAV